MFLSVDDYRVVTCPADLNIICQSDDEIRQKAERTAMEEIAGYVRARYDIEAAFAASGSDRNPLLVQLTVSIAIWWLGQWLPGMMGGDTRLDLYNNAIARLRDIQKGNFIPDFPTYASYPDADPDTGWGSNPMRYGSMKKNGYDW